VTRAGHARSAAQPTRPDHFAPRSVSDSTDHVRVDAELAAQSTSTRTNPVSMRLAIDGSRMTILVVSTTNQRQRRRACALGSPSARCASRRRHELRLHAEHVRHVLAAFVFGTGPVLARHPPHRRGDDRALVRLHRPRPKHAGRAERGLGALTVSGYFVACASSPRTNAR